MQQEFTHKGWLGIAPIYCTIDGANITERGFISGLLLSFSTWMVKFINNVFDTEYPFPIRITGKLKNPVFVRYGDE